MTFLPLPSCYHSSVQQVSGRSRVRLPLGNSSIASFSSILWSLRYFPPVYLARARSLFQSEEQVLLLVLGIFVKALDIFPLALACYFGRRNKFCFWYSGSSSKQSTSSRSRSLTISVGGTSSAFGTRDLR